MLDVHPPHKTVHTWQDFFIHIATISVGLLIAIGLEHTVGWIHHRYQRIELEAQLHEEALENADRNKKNYGASDAELQWLLSLQLDVQSMIGGNPRLVYRARPESAPRVPINWIIYRTSAWEAAKVSGTVALLEPEVAQKYAGSYTVGELAIRYRLSFYDALMRQLAYESKFVSAACPGTPDFERMTLQQLEEYSTLIGQSFAAGRYAKYRLRVFDASNIKLLDKTTAQGGDTRSVNPMQIDPDQFYQPEPGMVAKGPPSQPSCR